MNRSNRVGFIRSVREVNWNQMINDSVISRADQIQRQAPFSRFVFS